MLTILIEAEQGEQIQTTDGSINQISNNAPTHEQGGVIVPDAHRVLENTSKLRGDANSKYLRLSPETVKQLTGLDTNKSMSHAQALAEANNAYEDQKNKIVLKINLASKGKKTLDKLAENSIKLNMDSVHTLPTKEQLFDNLFNHQEAVKASVGIKTGEKGKFGGKFQVGGTVSNVSLHIKVIKLLKVIRVNTLMLNGKNLLISLALKERITLSSKNTYKRIQELNH
jgi:hypothetical protein